MNNPILSVIIPVFNTEATLKKCIDSIMNQSIGSDIEIIVVDDCSPGHPEKIISEYETNQVRIIHHKVNKGLFAARVTGSLFANGEFIAFVDSDDHISLDFYKPLISSAINHNADIIAGNTIRCDEDGNYYPYTLHKHCFPKELIGNDVQNAYFSQQGTCYAWHTVWNKIYKKTLWDKCLSAYKSLDRHIIMTEDIAFSTLLFFHARHFTSVDSGAYYYCFNKSCSTNQSSPSFSKFKKNIEDMTTVFDFVIRELKNLRADQKYISDIEIFRLNYAKQWLGLWKEVFAFSANSKQGLALLTKLANTQIHTTDKYVSWFENTTSTLLNSLEEIRSKIIDPKIKLVSFDIFDTLVKRSTWDPADIFEFMQSEFIKIVPTHKSTKFSYWRSIAEEICRNKIGSQFGSEDVTISQIYNVLGQILQLQTDITNQLLDLEIKTELRFLSPRETGKQLLNFAITNGKKVVYTSDMYLEENHIRLILKRCGYPELPLFLSSTLKILKSSGELFKYLIKYNSLDPKEILHIGDSWDTDICKAKKLSLETAFLPKAKDVFTNGYKFNQTNDLSHIGFLSGANYTTPNMIMKSKVFRSMLSLVSNRFFDNPFESWNPNSNFDANPDIIGYYPVGMHLVAISSWLTTLAKKYNSHNIIFLGRDGFLPQKSFEIMRNFNKANSISSKYLPCSRQALLPVIINSKEGFFNLPISYRSHTPKSILNLISFCHNIPKNEIESVIYHGGFPPNKKFNNISNYIAFIEWFTTKIFNKDKLESAKELVSIYYRNNIPSDSIVFDLGYSGSIAIALDKAVGSSLRHAFIHYDPSSFDDNVKINNAHIDVMYDFVTQNRDLIRELLVSELDNQCLGFRKIGNKIEPIFNSASRSRAEIIIMNRIFDNALNFVSDFSHTFNGVFVSTDIHPQICSAPLEGFLSTQNTTDKSIFNCVRSDDSVFGNSASISVADFWASLPDTIFYPYLTFDKNNQTTKFKSLTPDAIINLKNCLEIYKHPIKVLKYKILSKISMSRNKRMHYRIKLALPRIPS